MLGLKDGRRIGDWVNPQPVNGEHAMDFMQFLPSSWRVEAAAAPGQPQDPYQPAGDLRGALAVYGGSLAYADQVLSLGTAPQPVADVPVVFPIPSPGWVQRIATRRWPSDLAAHMSPSQVTNQ